MCMIFSENYPNGDPNNKLAGGLPPPCTPLKGLRPGYPKNIAAFLDELSFIFELPFIIHLSFIIQPSFTLELPPMKNEYANFPAFGRDFKKQH